MLAPRLVERRVCLVALALSDGQRLELGRTRREGCGELLAPRAGLVQLCSPGLQFSGELRASVSGSLELRPQGIAFGRGRRSAAGLRGRLVECRREPAGFSPRFLGHSTLLAELQTKKMIADLSHVCVYVSGVSAPSAELAQNIGRFWEAYFRRAGADVDQSRYAHVLLHWPPPTSCHLQ